MEHSLPLISTLVIAFSLALIFGFLSERLFKAPPLVGYLLAGIAAGQYTPGVFADPALAHQLSELGIMLLMFGVGLHFSVKDLLSVKFIAVPGAVLQMFIATLLGGLVAHFAWGWHWGEALVLGMCLSCASTVVLLKALEVRGILPTHNGQIAVGWLVVEDIATVLILVLLPPLAGLLGSQPSSSVTGQDIAIQIAVTLGNVAAFIAVMFVIGRRLLPWLMTQVARTGSRELFTLFVLASAVGIAYGAAAIFSVSFALGAFFAGMVMRESRFAHRAATESLPLQDAFCVLFFVGVGMLFDWHILVEAPLSVLTVLLIIMLGKGLAAFGLVYVLRYPLQTALIVSASLAQIGEFSFILVAQARELGLADDYTMNLIVGAAILSIALNPVVFSLIPRLSLQLTSRWGWAREAAMREEPFEKIDEETPTERLRNQIVLTGESSLLVPLATQLHHDDQTIIVVTPNQTIASTLDGLGITVIAGTPSDTQTLAHAHLQHADLLLVLDNSTTSIHIIETARAIKADIPITIVAADPGIWADVPGYNNVRFVNTESFAATALSQTLAQAVSRHEVFGELVQTTQPKSEAKTEVKSDSESEPKPEATVKNEDKTEAEMPPLPTSDAQVDSGSQGTQSDVIVTRDTPEKLDTIEDRQKPETTETHNENEQKNATTQVERPGLFDFLRRK